MLQETHTISTDHEKWKRKWDGPIFFSDGESNCRGVPTLIPQKLTSCFEIIETKTYNNGRFLLTHCKLSNQELNLDSYSDKHIIIGGDLNTYLDIEIDKKEE